MDSKELEGKKVAELKEMAKELGIKGISSMKKADLVAAISSAAEAPPEPVPAPEPEVETAPEPEPAGPGGDRRTADRLLPRR